MAKITRTEYSTLNILTGIGGYIVNTLLGLACRMVFTRMLSADYLGVNGLFTNILSMLSLAELGIGTAIVYALYKPLAENDKPRIAMLVKFYGQCYKAIGIFIAFLGLCLMPFLNKLISEQPNISESIFVIYALYLFNTASTYFFSYRGSLLMAAQQNYIVTGINYFVTISQSIIQMLFLVMTHSYMLYLIIQTVGTLVYNILISNIAKRRFPFIADKKIPALDRPTKKDLSKNIRALIVIKISGMLVNQTDSLIITYFNGLVVTGYTSNYTLLSGTLNSLLNIFFSGITASVGNFNAVEDRNRKLNLFHNINFINFWLFGWAAIGIFLVSNDLVSLLFGNSYVLPLSIPFVIALNFYLVGMQSAVWTFKNTLGLFRPGRYLLIITAILNLACSIYLGEMWGVFGILLATSISRLFTNIWYDPYAIFKYGFQESVFPYFKKYLKFALILFLTGGICYYLCSLCHFTIWANVIVKFIICCIVPNAVFLVCFYRAEEFQYFVHLAGKVVNKIKRKQ